MQKSKLHTAHLLLFASVLYFQCCTAKADTDAIWLARSCVGEAGWDAWKTGECAAILHVYRKRAAITGETVVQLASRYSAAIKRYKGKRNRWVLTLKEDCERPAHWPASVEWERYRFHWVVTLIFVEFFMRDMAEDPLPEALHYGCVFDIPPKGFKRINTRFRNRFYRR